MKDNKDKLVIAESLKGSLLEFCIVFLKIATGRDFIISNPTCRESHFVTISKALTKAYRNELPSSRLIINVPPGHGKSTMLCMWVAWCMAQNPDSRFLYISYSKTLASKHTEFIRRIMTTRHYEYLFGVKVRKDSHAKDFFQTEAGGAVGAYGSTGSITGQDAGLPGLDRFSGAIIIDDPHKPDEVHSERIRESVIKNYRETIQQRARSPNVPFIFIGQRLHEDDLGAYLINSKDGYDWEKIIIKSLDGAGNPLYPEAFPLEMLLKRKEHDKYVFYSQFQQDPTPAGENMFRNSDFAILDEEPEIKATFLTIDTAETTKSYNDATVFSFWGIYNLKGDERGDQGDFLHWIDCVEIRVEPRELNEEFLAFYGECNLFKVKPTYIAIEKKSTGVTLYSQIESLRGVSVLGLARTSKSGSKTQRFLNIQPIVSQKRISFSRDARHSKLCIDHMSKITANGTHRFDDIADTLADAIDLSLLRKEITIKRDRVYDPHRYLAESLRNKRNMGGLWPS